MWYAPGMYQPPHFREDNPGIQHALIRAHPLGLLVTMGAEGLEANLIPFVLDTPVGGPVALRGHLARPNPQWRGFDAASEALVVFQGPEAYITPSWYSVKAETGKVVPTWNYVVVQVHGRVRAVEDAGWLRQQIENLTNGQEKREAAPWKVSDAPEAYVAGQIRGIVGIEIAVTRIEGKWKTSQNRPAQDHAGIIAGLTAVGDAEMAALVKSRTGGKP
jgi:transcriptional regulator